MLMRCTAAGVRRHVVRPVVRRAATDLWKTEWKPNLNRTPSFSGRQTGDIGRREKSTILRIIAAAEINSNSRRRRRQLAHDCQNQEDREDVLPPEGTLYPAQRFRSWATRLPQPLAASTSSAPLPKAVRWHRSNSHMREGDTVLRAFSEWRSENRIRGKNALRVDFARLPTTLDVRRPLRFRGVLLFNP